MGFWDTITDLVEAATPWATADAEAPAAESTVRFSLFCGYTGGRNANPSWEAHGGNGGCRDTATGAYLDALRGRKTAGEGYSGPAWPDG